MHFKLVKPVFTCCVLAVFLVLFSCQNDTILTHYSGLPYKIITKSKDTTATHLGDVLALKYRILDSEGVEIEQSVLFRIQLKEPSHDGGAVEDGLSILHKGDSAVFYINAENYFAYTRQAKLPEGIDSGANIQFHVKLVDIICKEDVLQEQEAAKLSGERAEEYLLKEFVKKNKIVVEPQVSGLYIIPIEEGKGDYPSPGKNVLVHYIGSFVDGNVFDSSYQRDEPFEFPLGIGKVILGWDEGISKMKIGGTYRLIIPSYLAYGQQQVGPIPPFSTLIFVVELLEANK